MLRTALGIRTYAPSVSAISPSLALSRRALHQAYRTSTPRILASPPPGQIHGPGRTARPPHRVAYGVESLGVARRRQFHATPRAQALPALWPLLATVFKMSSALEIARTVGRITLTFAPVIVVKNMKSRKKLAHVESLDLPGLEDKKKTLLERIRRRTILFHALIFAPVALFWLALLASLEQTPLTGRWRMILLSPDEEDEIAAQLAGDGWRQAVTAIVAHDPDTPARILPATDWRHAWAEQVLRRLEAALPLLSRESELGDAWLGAHDGGAVDSAVPLPPPAVYPMRPRPRASEMLHHLCDAMCKPPAAAGADSRAAAIAGAAAGVPAAGKSATDAPYQLMLVEDARAQNAFSYGFGPDGGGGVVLFTGFIDDVLERHPLPPPPPHAARERRPWWVQLLGVSGAGGAPAHAPRAPEPTAAQTRELAVLMAHELAHLVLSHHLETLSSGTVVVPGIASIASDLVRVLIFPLTMLFGPFVNDAVGNVGRATSIDLVRIGEHCTSWKQEIEADVVSARLLAYAGYDARDALQFWERRAETPETVECTPGRAKEKAAAAAPEAKGPVNAATKLTHKIMGQDHSHPQHAVRVAKLRKELTRWETERQAALERRREQSAA